MGDFGGCLFAAFAYTNAPSFVKKPEPLVTADFQRHERLRAIPSASGNANSSQTARPFRRNGALIPMQTA